MDIVDNTIFPAGTVIELPFGAAARSETEFANGELEATGYCQVLVVLEPSALPDTTAVTLTAPRRRRRGSANLIAAVESDVQTWATPELADLERYFTVAPAAQDAALAVANARSAMKHVQRTYSLQPTAEAHAALGDLVAAIETEPPKVRVYPNLGLMLGTVDNSGLSGLQSDSRVREVHVAPQLSLIRPTDVAAAKKQTGLTWGLQLLEVEQLWNAGITGEGVLVAHLDTGVDASHPALNGAIAQFAEFDLLGKLVANATAHDSDTHGTHTAGTIVGRRVSNTSFGVAPGAQLASALVIEGGNVVARILAGMDWAVGLKVRILSMSLGLRGYTPAFLTLTRLLRARGVLPVFAVGNEGPGTSRSPGNYVEALSVGACDQNQTIAGFSSSQRFARASEPVVPDLVGPGVQVVSCVPGGKYAVMSGTSMATPHVAGLAALLAQASPSATPDQIETAIFNSCALPPGVSAERGNRGVPNAVRAFEHLTGQKLATLGSIGSATQASALSAPDSTSRATKGSAKKKGGAKRVGGNRGRARSPKARKARKG
jgi:subtilisin